MRSTDTVLVTGASGGVGSAAVQLATARGARVIAVTSPAKADDVKDLVAGPKWPSLLEVLRPGGRYAVSGAIAGPIVELDVRTLYLKDLTFFGCTVLEPDVFGRLVRHIEDGQVRPVVARTYPLSEIGQAQAAFQTKSHIGKIVLSVGS